ncbi:unnamed protein product [Trypanosoma congolense IL3000]|uniref:Putative clathrin coat assembly protein ap19 n=1 Tax=Trypanosoma congolense (strain IL3000) TaxID=1068625 RepID=F9WBA2_TRYCI|nr:putative clathrin coat assembly protein ap19 [Trypanosoma congolense IL3000]CCD14533.1 unnamed protein product [Trypanosoma congolense IL3000]
MLFLSFLLLVFLSLSLPGVFGRGKYNKEVVGIKGQAGVEGKKGSTPAHRGPMIKYLLLISRQGKLRLAKWYVSMPKKEKARVVRELCQTALGRSAKFSNMLENRGSKFVCKRYASLYFIACIEKNDNELAALEIIHHFVEILDRYFGNVCELDLIFNFHRAYFVLDEVLLGGELEDTSKRSILKNIEVHEAAAEDPEISRASGAAAGRPR